MILHVVVLSKYSKSAMSSELCVELFEHIVMLLAAIGSLPFNPTVQASDQ